MEEIFVGKVKEIIQKKNEIEKKLNLKVTVVGRRVIIKGDSLDEYEAELVFEAIRFGFTVKKALLLKDEDVVFRKIHIKDHTHRKNLRDIVSRLVGTRGKTRRALEEISGCDVIIRDYEVGLIGEAENIEDATTAIINLIKGAKQTNMYRFLERMNRVKKEEYGLKD